MKKNLFLIALFLCISLNSIGVFALEGSIGPGNGRITPNDYNIISDYVFGKCELSSSQLIQYDLNKDGRVTITDLSYFNRLLLGTYTSL